MSNSSWLSFQSARTVPSTKTSLIFNLWSLGQGLSWSQCLLSILERQNKWSKQNESSSELRTEKQTGCTFCSPRLTPRVLQKHPFMTQINKVTLTNHSYLFPLQFHLRVCTKHNFERTRKEGMRNWLAIACCKYLKGMKLHFFKIYTPTTQPLKRRRFCCLQQHGWN